MTELIKKKKQVPERLYSNKKLAALLIPLALDQLLNSFMGTIDTLVVSNLGSAAISAVSLVDSINILIVQAFFALGLVVSAPLLWLAWGLTSAPEERSGGHEHYAGKDHA